MKRFYFILTFATLLTAINIAPACAQGSELAEALIPESNYKGNGITIDDAAKSESVVFFNVGNKKFLNAGGLWGTEAATHTAGLFMKLEKKAQVNIISTPLSLEKANTLVMSARVAIIKKVYFLIEERTTLLQKRLRSLHSQK